MCRLLTQAVSPRSKKLKGPGGLALPSPVDPGHLLTKLNGDAAPKRCKRHEFSLDTCLGPTIFHRTKACHAHASPVTTTSHLAPSAVSLLLLCTHFVCTQPCLPSCRLAGKHVPCIVSLPVYTYHRHITPPPCSVAHKLSQHSCAVAASYANNMLFELHVHGSSCWKAWVCTSPCLKCHHHRSCRLWVAYCVESLQLPPLDYMMLKLQLLPVSASANSLVFSMPPI